MFLSSRSVTITVLILMALNSAAIAQDNSKPAELNAIYVCKSLTNDVARLACYDTAVGSLETAEQKGEIVTISKNDIEKVKRDAFGFNIPSLPNLGGLFRGSKPSDPKSTKPSLLTDSIKSTEQMPSSTVLNRPEKSTTKKVELQIRKTTQFARMKTRFFFENGQVWEQVEDKEVRIPKSRDGLKNTAIITKATLGSFRMRINGKGAAIRVRRVR